MSTPALRLANHLRRTIDGPMWHGPALADLVKQVSAREAMSRPIPGVHSIAELVVHITAWATIARQRLAGTAPPSPTPEEDWPSAAGLDDETAWTEAIAAMRESYHALAGDVKHVDDATITGPVPGRDHSVYAMLHGVIEHGTYHGGQIALLIRAMGK